MRGWLFSPQGERRSLVHKLLRARGRSGARGGEKAPRRPGGCKSTAPRNSFAPVRWRPAITPLPASRDPRDVEARCGTTLRFILRYERPARPACDLLSASRRARSYFDAASCGELVQRAADCNSCASRLRCSRHGRLSAFISPKQTGCYSGTIRYRAARRQHDGHWYVSPLAVAEFTIVAVGQSIGLQGTYWAEFAQNNLNFGLAGRAICEL